MNLTNEQIATVLSVVANNSFSTEVAMLHGHSGSTAPSIPASQFLEYLNGQKVGVNISQIEAIIRLVCAIGKAVCPLVPPAQS
jgi:hypothetical protein